MHQELQETFSKYDTIILVGGGTGGHIQPIINISEELEDKKLLWIGGKDSNEEQEARRHNIDFESIPTLKLTTTKSPKVLLYPFILLIGILDSRKILGIHSESHACIFSKGGPGSVAIGIAAWTLGIPLYIHESDTIPGRSNRILGKIATKIFLGFEKAKKYFDTKKCETIGQILSPIFLNKNTYGSIVWKTDKKHIFVTCGSQGSRAIFNTIANTCSDLDIEWIIILGKLNTGINKEFQKFSHIQLFDWIEQKDQKTILESTDFSIVRAGATTLAELDLFNIRKIIVPLPYSADNHQYWNAKEYEKKGDILLEQKDLNQLNEIIKKYASK